VAHILPKLSIIVVTLDLVLGVNYETYDFILRNTLANIPKTKTFKGCVMIFVLKKALPVVIS